MQRRSERFRQIGSAYYVLWILFVVWLAAVVVGYISYINLIYETTSALPLVNKTYPSQTCEINGDNCYMGATYTRKYTFIWSTCIITVPFRIVTTLAVYSYLMGTESSKGFGVMLAFFGILQLVSEGANIISHGLEWKNANKKPDGLSDTRYDRNVANSYDYCCLYGNYTPFCPNHMAFSGLPAGVSSPCYGVWNETTTELKVNADFMVSAIMAICCFAFTVVVLLLASCRRYTVYRKATFDNGEQVLVRTED